jgi:uncharacterized glyoxalase superfamily protein PhnB
MTTLPTELSMQVNPYLTFNGNCEEAFKTYQKILGGEIAAMIPHEGTPAEERACHPIGAKRSSMPVSFRMAWC